MLIDATLRALLFAVCKYPDDIDRRLIFADACEETGDVERAEFIRVQVEFTAKYAHHAENGHDHDDCAGCILRRRERELLIGSPTSWGANGQFSDYLSSLGYLWDDAAPWPTWKHRNGFVESITCTAAQWLEHGPAIVLASPVRKVRLTDDRVPGAQTRGGFVWYPVRAIGGVPSGPYCLPDELWELLSAKPDRNNYFKWYPHSHDANDDLNRAALTWARRLAGLDD